MSSTQINQLPSGIANINAVVAADNADLSVTEKITLGDIAKLGTELSGSQNLYVDGARTDLYTADGTIHRPYKTIQDAVNYAETLTLFVQENGASVVDLGVVINIAPYRYLEHVTISKPRIYLKGCVPNQNATIFSSVRFITINSVFDAGGVNGNQYGITNMLLLGGDTTPATPADIEVAGNIACRVVIENCQLYSDDNQKCLVVSNTSNNPRVFCRNVVFNNTTENTTNVERTLAGGVIELNNSSLNCGNATAIVFAGAILGMNNTVVNCAGDSVISLSGTGQFHNIGNCTFNGSKTNSSGIVLAGTVALSSVQNVFNVKAGTGYAVTGPVGTKFTYALDSFAPGSNTSINTTVNAIPFTTPIRSNDVSYDNTASNLSATNVKAALDELAPKKIYNETQDTYYDTIQAAIDAASNNDIVYVAPGTYREFIYIYKPLTLRGPNYDKRGDDAHRGPEAVLEYSYAAVGTNGTIIYADSDNVTVEGFDLRYPDSLIKNGHNSAVTFTDDGDLVTCNNHGFENGDVIMFSARATTTGISTYTGYFVINATTNTFQLASTANGAALPLTNNGTGTIFGAAGWLWFSYEQNNLVIRNNRWYGGEVPIFIYFAQAGSPLVFLNKTGGVIEGNYIDCGPFVNSSFNRAIYCADLACTIQDNVIVNSDIGIQVSQYTNPVASLIQRNSISASGGGLYSNAHYNGGGTVTWKNNTVTAAPNDRLGLKQRVSGALTGLSAINGLWVRSTGVNSTGTAPNVVFTNNVVDLTLDPAKVYNSTVLRGLLFQDVHKTVTTTINNNSVVGWTVAARSQATNGAAVASSIDANLSANWWGTATLSKLVLESTVVSGSIVVSSVLAGKTAGDGTVLLRGFNVPLSSDVTYDNATSGLTATNVKAVVDELASSKVTNAGNVASIKRLTQAEYDLIVTPDPNTLYIIVG
jgi:hypothetical protein